MAKSDPKGARPGSLAATRMAFAALLRFLVRSTAWLEDADDGGALLVRADARSRRFPLPVIRAARARGLLEGDDSALHLTEAGRAALRRLLSDPDSAWQDQHRDLVRRTDAEGETMLVNTLESPLAALARIKDRNGKRWLSDEMVAAGDRLRADFDRGQLMPGVSQRWEPVIDRGGGSASGGLADFTDAALAARRRVEKALDAVGPEISGLLVDVCCFLKGLEQVERERQWPQRSAKLMLSAGLRMLDRHYNPPSEPRRSPLRVWGGDGYRPELGDGIGF